MALRLSFPIESAASRALLVVPLMLLGLWFAVTTTLSAVLTQSAAPLAIRLNGGNSRAMETEAAAAALEMTLEGARRAIALGRRALIASPLSSEGAAALGAGRGLLSPQADLLPVFAYSEFLSRRTALSQVWMVEHNIALGDIPGALRRYDHLFRVYDDYRARFLPVLLQASAEPDIARAMVPLLATRPPWRDEYFSGLLATFPGPENFVRLVRAFRLDARDPEGAQRLSIAMARLVESNRPDLAFGLYPGASDAVLVRNGDFSRVGGLAPFDWELAENDALLAEPGVNDAGAPVLQLTNRAGKPGPLARQLLMLRPGAYRLSFAVGNVAGAETDRPQLVLHCLAGAPLLSATVFPVAPAAGRAVGTQFSVPAQGCAAQWLVIQAGNPIDAIATQQWVTRIRVAPSAPAQE